MMATIIGDGSDTSTLGPQRDSGNTPDGTMIGYTTYSTGDFYYPVCSYSGMTYRCIGKPKQDRKKRIHFFQTREMNNLRRFTGLVEPMIKAAHRRRYDLRQPCWRTGRWRSITSKHR